MVRLLLTVVLASVMVVGGSGGLVDPTSAVTPAVVRATEEAAHRVVWDRAPKRGSDLRSANLDGSDEARLFSTKRGVIDNLSISPDGEHVAFGLYRRNVKARLLVAPVTGGRAVNVLRHVAPMVSVGPIGWSRNGARLVFDGAVEEPSAGNFYPSYLFTIRLDGTGLRRVTQVSDGTTNGEVFGGIAWTRTGIVYPDGRSIRKLRHGRSVVMFRNSSSFYPSGDGRMMIFRMWPSSPTAQDEHRIYRSPTNRADRRLVARYRASESLPAPLVPNHTGSDLMGLRGIPGSGRPQVFTAPVERPRDVHVLAFVDRAFAIAWS